MPPSFSLCGTMKYSVSESGEVSDAEAYAFEDLCLVVAAFRIAIGILGVESLENRFAPVVQSPGAGIEFG